ncbi:MAG TPA: tripartite tricarboxylate transporter substrate binding protein [Burkholderiales bacterium]|nr:tripartite tricarboxylate transporter substrate binding protein [Burkholderiales bacterium]
MGAGSRLGVALFVSCAVGCVAARAAEYPDRPIRMIVPQAPGSASDTVARIIGAELTSRLKQQVVVDNRPGGALLLGLELTAKAPPDGYTIGYAMIGALAISPNVVSKPPLDVQKDLAPISQTTTGQMLLAAGPATSFKSVRDVIAYAKQNPGKLNYASSGNGTPGHVGMELFKVMTGTQMVHVPYKGGAAGITELIAGQMQLMLESTNSITPHAKAGRVRGLAVTGAKRSEALPELPTIAEAGVPGYEATTWTGMVAPAGMPRTIIMKLNAEINQMVASPSFKERVAPIGSEPMAGTPEQFAQFIKSESAKWADVIRRSGAKID